MLKITLMKKYFKINLHLKTILFYICPIINQLNKNSHENFKQLTKRQFKNSNVSIWDIDDSGNIGLCLFTGYRRYSL